jgi:hypothetical protein
MENEIITKRGRFGRIQVTVPMDTKYKMLDWYKKSGLGKAEFFRVALMMGTAQLADQIKAKPINEWFKKNE